LPVRAGQEECIAYQDRADEYEIEEVVHVVAPFGDSGVSVSAEGAVEGICEPLEQEHRRRAPEPVEAALCEPAEEDQADRPGDGHQGQVVALYPFWEARCAGVD